MTRLIPMAENSNLRDWLEKNIPLEMTKGKMPGFSIAVVKDGETIYSEGFGSKDPERDLPATPHTLYGIGSITKSFVAIGIMQLVEAGKIQLNDPVSRHIPFELGIPDQPITIHHLLTHSLGIPSLATSTVAILRGLGVDTGVPLSSANDFYRFVNGAKEDIIAKPGERFFYHNAAWRMLGHIIQETSGMPFHRYLKEKVINPIGMKRTTLNVRDFEGDPDHAVLHIKTAGGINKPSRFPYPNPEDNPEFSFLSAAGGILSSVDEMSRYLNVQVEKGICESGQLASKESFERMQAFHIQRPNDQYGQQGYGYGLGITSEFFGHKMVNHGGSVLVSTAYMAFIPDLRIGVIMMGNSAGMSDSTIAQSVLAILLGKNPAKVIPQTRIKAEMESLTGTYKIYRGLAKIEVRIKNGMLYIEQKSPFTSEISSTPLIPEDPTLESTLFYTLSFGVRSPVEFRMRDKGKVDLLLERYCYHRSD